MRPSMDMAGKTMTRADFPTFTHRDAYRNHVRNHRRLRQLEAQVLLASRGHDRDSQGRVRSEHTRRSKAPHFAVQRKVEALHGEGGAELDSSTGDCGSRLAESRQLEAHHILKFETVRDGIQPRRRLPDCPVPHRERVEVDAWCER